VSYTAGSVYVFTALTAPVALTSAAPSSNVTITSTKDGVARNYSVTSAPSWLKATISGSTLTLAVNGAAPTTNQSGTVVLTQVTSNKTIAIDVAYTAPVAPPAPVYIFTVSPTTTVGLSATTASVTRTITSTKDGLARNYSVTSAPSWLKATISGNLLTLTVNGPAPTTNQSGIVVLTQVTSNKTITINVTYTAR